MRTGRLTALLVLLLLCALLAPRSIDAFAAIFRQLHDSFVSEELAIPMWVDYVAVFVFGVSGALVARRKNYDYVGAFVLATVTAVGGAMIRDGICIQDGISPIFQDGNYMISLILAWLCGMLLGGLREKFDGVILFCDALGLGLYAVFGTNKALVYGLSVPVAVAIGFVNAVGGGFLRDIVAREEPLVFKPGQFYAGVAVVGSLFYVFLYKLIPPTVAAIVVALFTLVLRYLVIRLNLHSSPIAATQAQVFGFLRIFSGTPAPRRERKNRIGGGNGENYGNSGAETDADDGEISENDVPADDDSDLPPEVFEGIDDVDDFEKRERQLRGNAEKEQGTD